MPFAAFQACGRAVATQPLVALLAASLGHCFWRVAVHAKLSWCTWALCRAALRRKVKQQLFCFFLLLHGRSCLRLEEHGLLLCGGFAQQGLQRRCGLQLLAVLRRKVEQQLFCFFLLLHGRSRLRLEEHGLLLCGGFAQQGLQRRCGLQLLAVGALGAFGSVSVVPVIAGLLHAFCWHWNAAVRAAMPTNDLRVSRVAAGGCP